jgi:integrase
MKGRIYANRGGYVVRFGRDVSRRFKHLDQAERFLTALRYKTDQGEYDKRDYMAGRPLAFDTLADKYLDYKRQTVKPRSYSNLRNYMTKATKAWGAVSIKDIKYAEIEDFLYSQNVSDKTKANIRSCLHDFYSWLRRRRILTRGQVPEFPQIKFELGFRQLVDMETQHAIIDEVHRISHQVNIKIWLGIKWLSVYVSIRPGELINIQEKHIDRDAGLLFVPHPKEKRPKIIPLLDSDIELLKSIPRGLNDLYFFRHRKGNGAAGPGSKFGKDYLYKWWKRACCNLGIDGVDLYGGTRHSTATALGRILTPEQIKSGTMHATNRAFERYFQRGADDSLEVYRAVQRVQHGYNKNADSEKDNVLEFNKKAGAEGGT